MLGYKGFNKGLINRYGKKFEEGKTYSVEGDISCGNEGNGIHFCLNIFDTFRYCFPKGEIEVALVSTNDTKEDLVYFEDEYNGYYDLYVCRNLKIEKVLSRKEVIELILTSSKDGIIKFIKTDLLTKEECEKFLVLDKDINKAIRYHQFGDKEVYCNERLICKVLKP